MKFSITIGLLLAGINLAWSSPFVISDPYPSGSIPIPTHCGVFLDATPRKEIPVANPLIPFCKYDLDGIAVGNHTIKMTFVVNDSLWGLLESAQSAALNFTKPAASVAPSGLKLIP